jgi:DNA gyrase subunit A
MANKDEATSEMFTENGDLSVTAGSVELREGDHRYDELLAHNFLVYAKSVLTDRALPDIRDGLLPVQRRILLAMDDLSLRPNRSTRKCAKVVGETMGNYHPHGDLAIYGALVRMAQDFSLRTPLVTGQGNFGNVDGDPPAASRYTECKLSEAAESLLGDLDPEVLPDDYGRNYDESRVEPNVLPAAYPNLLINGQIGIAVGMTCKMLPHNPGEVLDLATWRLANPEARPETVVKRLSGPDFPTGALVVADEAMRQAYLTGEGKVVAVGEAHIEPANGNREQIVITSLPWGVTKGQAGSGSGLLEVLDRQFGLGQYPEFSDMHDYSTDDMRIVIELKRGSNAKAVLQRIYKHTRLRETYGVQMNVLVNGVPKTVNLSELIDHFLDFRRYVIIKIAEKRIRWIESRLHELDAYLKALSAIDAVIKLIRGSKDRHEANPKLQKLLKIDEQQGNWILDMRLHRLTALDRHKLEDEVKTLKVELTELRTFIKTPALVTEKMVGDFRELKKLMGAPRQTKLIGDDAVGDDAEVMADFSVPAEDCMLLISSHGHALCGQGTLKRGASLQLAPGDHLAVVEDARSDEEWLVFTAAGKAFRLRLAELPLENKRHKGQHISELGGFEADDRIIGAHKVVADRPGSALFIYASGTVKRTSWDEFTNAHGSGVVAAKPAAGDQVVAVYNCADEADIILVGSHGKAIRFPAEDARPMGRAANGVRGIKLPAGVRLIGSACVLDPTATLLLATSTRFAKRIPLLDIPPKGRGGGGVVLMKTGGKYGEPAVIAVVETDKDELHIHTTDGKLKEQPASRVPRAGRTIVPKPCDPITDAVAVFVRRGE